MTTTKQLYRHFITETPFPWCWLCGRDKFDRPAWWHAGWVLHRAHIVSTPRNEDVRVINILCPWCHGVKHGLRYAAEKRPPITLANMLWIKERFHPEAFDTEFLQHFAVKVLPTPEEPHEIYLREYRERRIT